MPQWTICHKEIEEQPKVTGEGGAAAGEGAIMASIFVVPFLKSLHNCRLLGSGLGLQIIFSHWNCKHFVLQRSMAQLLP
jgi:hypothetical protein